MGNVPKLRFNEFQGDWEQHQLGDVGKVSMCKRIFKEQTSSNAEIPFFKIGTFGKSPDAYIDKSLYEEFKAKYSYPKVGEILISASGTIGRTVVFDGAPSYFQDSNIVWLANDESLVTNRFLLHVYENTRWTTEDTTIARLYNDNLKRITFSAPSLAEQQKIAAFLTSVDTKIEQLTKKEQLLQQYKKGVMQKIFSQEIRFKAEDGSEFPEWICLPMSQLGKTFNGLTGKTAEDFGEGRPYIQYKQIFDSSKIDLAKTGLVKIVSGERQQVVKYGDVFFTTSSETPNEVAYASVLLDDVDNLYLNSFCFGYRINSLEEFLPQFARYYFRSEGFRREAIKLAQGSTRYNISKTELMKTGIRLPSIDEQRKISLCLSAFDNKLTQVSSQLEAAKTFKKGLLQQMFV